MKFHLYRVRLNKGGYDSSGCYWGVGLPLFEAYTDNCGRFMHIRAHDRAQAKDMIATAIPDAKFYR